MKFMDLVRVAGFPSRLEAEAVGNALTQYEIPFFVKSEDLGIFGPGHTGATPQGAVLLVPREYEDRVKKLLSCLYQEEDEEENTSE